MPTWFMYREGQQYGPYTADQLLQMYHSQQLDARDLYLQNGSQTWQPLSQALPGWQNQIAQPSQQPAYEGKPPRRKKKRGCLITLLVFLLVAAGLLTAFLLTRTSDVVQTGRSLRLAQEKVDVSGGSLTVDEPGHSLDGLRLTVPEGAYDKPRSFEVSARPVEQHRLGKDVDVLTPLISIDNGHAFAAEPMLLTIPIRLKEGQFAMGFYYDRKTGALEGIPFSELTETHITLVTHHFSDILVAATDLQTLLDLSVDSGFLPGLDDWQFTNRGSAIAPTGHCAGQSLTAMFYYTEIYLAQKEPRLFGRFDNNRYGAKTAPFQDDDSWGYRFASVAQKEMAWNTRSLNLQQTIGKASDLYSLAAFAFAMRLTGEPQMVYIAGGITQGNGQPYYYAHAMIAYKIEEGRVYVADPNYPGKSDRFISFGPDGAFQPYGSGENADDIVTNGVLPFTVIRYLAKTSLTDYSRLREQYSSMQRGVIGDDDFPDCLIEYLMSVDEKTGEENWVPLKEDLELTSEDTEKAGSGMRGKLKIRVTNMGDTTLRFAFYKGLSPVSGGGISWQVSSAGDKTITTSLSEGVQHLGIKIEHSANNAFKYTDFRRVQIVYDQQAEITLAENYRVLNQQTYSYTAKVKDAPTQVSYEWQFGDHEDPVVTDVPTVSYKYADGGDYLLTLTMKDSRTGKMLAMADAPVEVLDLVGTWQLDYTIEESGLVDQIVTQVVKVFARFIAQLFETEIDDSDFSVTLKGTVIGCVMDVLPPSSPEDPVRIRLQQLTSSTDFVEPSDEVWTGVLTLKDDQVLINITAEGQPTGITFRGTLSQGQLYGDMNAVVFSGSFQATR